MTAAAVVGELIEGWLGRACQDLASLGHQTPCDPRDPRRYWPKARGASPSVRCADHGGGQEAEPSMRHGASPPRVTAPCSWSVLPGHCGDPSWLIKASTRGE